jgi:hypothetical protein
LSTVATAEKWRAKNRASIVDRRRGKASVGPPQEDSMHRVERTALAIVALLTASCGGSPPPYGPYWTYVPVTPVFTAKQDSVSTSFNGHVYPETHFVLGTADGFTFDKPNARLTINATTVWQYDLITVNLFDGPADGIGTPAALVAHWDIQPPPLGGPINFVNSQSLGGRTPAWVVVDFRDFSASCILEVLGHD